MPVPDFPRPDAALLALRPQLPVQPPDPADAALGHFLHQTLRPLLKLQHPLLLRTVADFAASYRLPLATAALVDQQRLLAELVERNMNLRYTIVGQISGQFTSAEIDFYRPHRTALNRRILSLAGQRVQESAAVVATLAAAALGSK